MRATGGTRRSKWREATLCAAICLSGCFDSGKPATPAVITPPKESNEDDVSIAPATSDHSSTATDSLPEQQADSEGPPPLSADQIEESSERLLLLAPRGPLLVRLFITLDGQPFRSELTEQVDRLLASADLDGDGVARWEEAAASEGFDVGPFAGHPEDDAQRAAMIKASDANRDGRVDRAELRRLLLRGQKASAEFTLDANSSAGERDPRRSPLWPLVAAAGEDWIGAEEAAAAARQLKARDLDDDDLLYPDELGLGSMPQPQQPNMPAQPAADREGSSILRVSDNTNWSVLRFTLAEMYAYEGTHVGEPPFFSHLARQLDADGDGRISAAEVLLLREAAPHVDLELRFEASQPAGLFVRSIAEDAAWSLKQLDGPLGRVALEGTGVRVQLDARDLAAAAGYEPAAQSQLAALDADKNGYLEKSELPDGVAEAAEQFAAADADGDGKLYLEEMVAFAQKQAAPNLRRIRAATAAAGDPLFGWLDGSHDGRLSPREWTAAVSRLMLLDADHDGSVVPDEIPFSVSLTLTRGTSDAAAGSLALPVPTPAPAPPAASAVVPSWFARMDSNSDGDISRREFLGDEEQFARLDANVDGFIDAQEAAAIP